MKKSTITFEIELDEKNIPEKIHWKATDAGDMPTSTDALAVSLWDKEQKNTLRIDLWTKSMRVDEMDKFLIDTLGGFGQTILNATGDTYISSEINDLCDRLAGYLQKKNYTKSTKRSFFLYNSQIIICNFFCN